MHSHRKTVLLVLAMLLLTTAFVGLVSGAQTSTQGRTPVPPGGGGPPTDPPTPPVQVACPSSFEDNGCPAGGKASGNDIFLALNQALLICDPQLQACQNKQAAELARNRQKCNAVPGCVLSYTVDHTNCDGSVNVDCQPGPNHIHTPASSYTCAVSAHHNVTGYECTRPAPTGGA